MIENIFSSNNLRLIFDNNISYKNMDSNNETTTFDLGNVMEIKTSINTSDNYLDEVISIQSSRFSKYSRRILSFSK